MVCPSRQRWFPNMINCPNLKSTWNLHRCVNWSKNVPAICMNTHFTQCTKTSTWSVIFRFEIFMDIPCIPGYPTWTSWSHQSREIEPSVSHGDSLLTAAGRQGPWCMPRMTSEFIPEAWHVQNVPPNPIRETDQISLFGPFWRFDSYIASMLNKKRWFQNHL